MKPGWAGAWKPSPSPSLSENDLAATENARLHALTDYRKTLIEYDRQAGRTLERRRIELLP